MRPQIIRSGLCLWRQSAARATRMSPAFRAVHTQKEEGTLSFSHAHFGGNGAPPPPPSDDASHAPREHAVISMFDLFSIGIGPSSSHTVGPMRAGAIFVSDLREAGLLHNVARIKLALYGSLAATGKGHMTPQALLLGLEGADCETVDTDAVPTRYDEIVRKSRLVLGKDTPEQGDPREIFFDYERDLSWMWGKTLPVHSNGMRMSVYHGNGDLLATNDFYSIVRVLLTRAVGLW